jgi:hypothetical protein
MKKLLLALSLLASGCATVAHAQVPISGSTGTFSSTVTAPIFEGDYSLMNFFPGSIAGTSAGYTGWGKNGTGDMDFAAANNGASPSFFWYFLLGSSMTAEMDLDTNGNLHVLNGGVLATNVTGTVAVTTQHYTVATLPSAASLGLGSMVVVTDGNGTIGPCTGGASTIMIAVSTGSAWTCR